MASIDDVKVEVAVIIIEKSDLRLIVRSAVAELMVYWSIIYIVVTSLYKYFTGGSV